MSKPVVVLYGAAWCGACKLIKPLLEMIAEVEYVDIDENIKAAQDAGVKSLPTYVNKETGARGSGPAQSVSALRETLGISK